MNTQYDFSQTPITELAAIISQHLNQQDIHVVLVGGLAVEFYTDNLYLTRDIDMVNTNYQPAKYLSQAMAELGFIKQGRVYLHASTNISVEFPPAPLSVGDELIQSTTVVSINGRELPILKIEDVIKDRLAAFFHWRDTSSLVQAVAMMRKHPIAPSVFHQFCLKEANADQYQLIDRFYQQADKQNCTTMTELEPLLSRLLLKQF